MSSTNLLLVKIHRGERMHGRIFVLFKASNILGNVSQTGQILCV